ncbi:hypothetical protein [Winogradskyella luteola]|uniref:Four helix bundle protein n=1 Tax=Winogradskyella luteola TaxID=2828330 RepID=A0A9X1F9V1_9FLAO|nr:hypothetical protein [Winogradskyella luteola]MBV7270109.1 hypothetical protein [Winogradskyella luteola]
MRNFKQLEIWKNGIQIVKQVYVLSQKLKFIQPEDLKTIFELLNKEAKMINSLINKIKYS